MLRTWRFGTDIKEALDVRIEAQTTERSPSRRLSCRSTTRWTAHFDAYANRMAVLGLTCGALAAASLGLFAYVRLQPPVVIRVDQTGEATVVAGETVGVKNGLLNVVKASGSPGGASGSAPSDVEGRAVVRKFLTSYLTYTPANVERQYADALNMMTLNFPDAHDEQVSVRTTPLARSKPTRSLPASKSDP